MLTFFVGGLVGLTLHGPGQQALRPVPLSWMLLSIAFIALLAAGLAKHAIWTGRSNRMAQGLCRSFGFGASFGLISLSNHDDALKFALAVPLLVLLISLALPEQSTRPESDLRPVSGKKA